MFEVEILCKNMDLKIQDLSRTNLLAGRRPIASSNDLNPPRAEPKAPEGERGPRPEEQRQPHAVGHTAHPPREPCAAAAVAAAAAAANTSGQLRSEAASWPVMREPAEVQQMHEEAARGGWTGAQQAQHAFGQGYQGFGEQQLMGLMHGIGGGGWGQNQQLPGPTPAERRAAMERGHSSDDFVVSNLPSLVTINPSIALFTTRPNLRHLVPHAVDRAIKEVINAVVERSVTISCLTTREMVTKDFAMEPDESVLKVAAQLMVSSVAGSLALVTCREPLRVSLTNNLWQLLLPHCQDYANNTNEIEQVVHVLSTENLELGCGLIEKAVIDKALKDIEESISPAMQARKQQKERAPSVPYYDQNYFQPGAKWPQALPEVLRPKPGPVPNNQLKVYKHFQNMPTTISKARLPTSVGPLNLDGHVAGSVAGQGLDASRTMPGAGVEYEQVVPSEQARDVLNQIYTSVDQVIQHLIADPPLIPPSDVTANPQYYKCLVPLDADDAHDACVGLSLLPLEHELIAVIRSLPQRLAAFSHPEVFAIHLAEHMFKRLYDVPQSVPYMHPPDTVSLVHLSIEVLLTVLETLKDMARDCYQRQGQGHRGEEVVKCITSWFDDIPTPQRYNLDIISGLLRYRLLLPREFDQGLARWIEARPHGGSRDVNGTLNAPAVDFAILLLQRVCLRQKALCASDLTHTCEALIREAQRSRQYQATVQPAPAQEAQLAESSIKVVEDLRSSDPLPHQGGARLKNTLSSRLQERAEEARASAQQSRVPQEELSNRETVINIFEEWHQTCSVCPDGVQSGGSRQGNEIWRIVSQHITTVGVGLYNRTDEAMEEFFKICCEHAVMRATSDAPDVAVAPRGEEEQRERDREAMADQAARDAAYGGEAPIPLSFAIIDSFTRLVVVLMKFADKAAVGMLTKAMASISKCLTKDAERRGANFNQRPYFRMILNLLMDVGSPDPNFEQANFQLLTIFCNTFHSCNPMRVPSFAFAWLDLISNRMFMPKLLMVKGQRGWLMFQRLLVQLLYFLEPYLRRVQLNDSTRLLYKGTIRMLLVLLHDFPEFLCDYHFAFCDIIPIPCVQIRNLILSAFPRNMKLPDPFMPNLKVDLLPEIKVAPRILANYTSTLLQQNLKADVDCFMRSREKILLDRIKEKLFLSKQETLQLDTKYNVPLLNALLLYVGVHLPQYGKGLPGQNGDRGLSAQNNPSLDIFTHLAHNFDCEGRYLFLSAIANHLRYPNTHTHYFSCVLLFLFADTKEEVVREQITRVLLERLIVHRPHPWGLLITFIELIKNRRYEFWNHSFVKCAPEVEKLFQSVAYTCLGTDIARQSEADGPPNAGPAA